MFSQAHILNMAFSIMSTMIIQNWGLCEDIKLTEYLLQKATIQISQGLVISAVKELFEILRKRNTEIKPNII